MLGYTINEMKVGQTASFSKTVTEYDVYAFAGVSGDMNPAHIDEEYASGTRFKKRIAHGVLSAGFISAAMGMHLPGPGAIYVKQSLKFVAPVYFGDTVTAAVTVMSLDLERNRAVMSTVCTNQDGKELVLGEALVMPRTEN